MTSYSHFGGSKKEVTKKFCEKFGLYYKLTYLCSKFITLNILKLWNYK